MTPKIAAEAMRSYVAETNRLNRERRTGAEATRRELADIAKAIAEIVQVIEHGGWHRSLSDRLTVLETKQDALTARLTEEPRDAPDIHPGIAETFGRRIERLTEALAHPDDAVEAADALREVIDRVVVTPGEKWGANTPSPCKASLARSSTGSTAPENPATSRSSTPLQTSCRFRSKPGGYPSRKPQRHWA
jgi:tRNA(Met) C34 N-acetyltransferase TmcA